jgi:hypothetical protein
MRDTYYKVLGDSGEIQSIVKESKSNNSLMYLVISNGKDWHTNNNYVMKHLTGIDGDGNTYNTMVKITPFEASGPINVFQKSIRSAVD